VLFLRAQTGSYATAGAVAAAFAFGAGAGAPFQGRLVDRHGQRRVLVPLLLTHAGALVLLVALGAADAPAVALGAVALVAGAALPPISSVLRTLWPAVLGGREDLVSTAFALDGVLVELVFVTGPLLTAAVTALLSPGVALLVAAALVVAGTTWFLSTPPSRAWRPQGGGEHHGALGALSSPGLRTLVVTTVWFGACFGAMEVTLPAFAEDHGSRATAGLLLSAWSLASATGGLVFGARQPGSAVALPVWFVRVAVVLPLAYVPLAAAPSMGVMALLLLPAGACIAPLLVAGNQLVSGVAPPGTETEAYTWPITSLVVGIAVGNAGAGAIVQAADWRVAFLAATGSAALGGLLALTRRGTLQHAG
jgi:MFS family permease